MLQAFLALVIDSTASDYPQPNILRCLGLPPLPRIALVGPPLAIGQPVLVVCSETQMHSVYTVDPDGLIKQVVGKNNDMDDVVQILDLTSPYLPTLRYLQTYIKSIYRGFTLDEMQTLQRALLGWEISALNQSLLKKASWKECHDILMTEWNKCEDLTVYGDRFKNGIAHVRRPERYQAEKAQELNLADFPRARVMRLPEAAWVSGH